MIFHGAYAARLVPLVSEAIRFPTVKGNSAAFASQQAWLHRVALDLGFEVRVAGPVVEIELPGPEGAPVLGLIVHGDVQPVDEADWSVPPFAGVEKDGFLWGRGSADDKGPLVQALLAMRSLRDSGTARTHTIRLLVGSDEESDNRDISTYLRDHQAPDLSLVLDSAFPVVVGEKAWNTLIVTAPAALETRANLGRPWSLVSLDAGTSTSIVPATAVAKLNWQPTSLDGIASAAVELASERSEGLGLDVSVAGRVATVTARGRAAHAGLNLEGGRNALVFLAKCLIGKVEASGASDLLAFAAMAGQDLYGTGLGLSQDDPLWGRYLVNVATIKAAEDQGLALTINLRRPPPLTGPELRARLAPIVADFNAKHDARLVASGFYDDEPLSFDPDSKIVRRLLASYAQATHEAARPAISGGATYAKRLPHAIAFGMWFPGKPYPGHDSDERVSVEDLLRGTDVLIEALADLATSPSISEPFVRSVTSSHESLDDAWWTGPMLANSAATLPKGHFLIEPYLYDVTAQSRYDRDGVRRSVPHSNGYGTLSYALYGLADRLSVGLIPTAGYNVPSEGPSSSSVGFGDLGLQAQYRLTQFRAPSHVPTISVAVQESLPTGRYDRLGQRPSDGFGSGAYTTTLALYSQTYFWMPSGRILRMRLNVAEGFPGGVNLQGVSVYGTGPEFRGRAEPGHSLFVDGSWEYSLKRIWVLALDAAYRRDGSVRVTGHSALDGASIRLDLDSSHTFYLAPAIEYSWNSNVGVLLGVRAAIAGRNTTATLTPAVAINFVH